MNREDRAKLQANARQMAMLADSWLDKWYMWQVSLPKYGTVIVAVVKTAAFVALGFFLHGGCA